MPLYIVPRLPAHIMHRCTVGLRQWAQRNTTESAVNICFSFAVVGNADICTPTPLPSKDRRHNPAVKFLERPHEGVINSTVNTYHYKIESLLAPITVSKSRGVQCIPQETGKPTRRRVIAVTWDFCSRSCSIALRTIVKIPTSPPTTIDRRLI